MVVQELGQVNVGPRKPTQAAQTFLGVLIKGPAWHSVNPPWLWKRMCQDRRGAGGLRRAQHQHLWQRPAKFEEPCLDGPDQVRARRSRRKAVSQRKPKLVALRCGQTGRAS